MKENPRPSHWTAADLVATGPRLCETHGIDLQLLDVRPMRTSASGQVTSSPMSLTGTSTSPTFASNTAVLRLQPYLSRRTGVLFRRTNLSPGRRSADLALPVYVRAAFLQIWTALLHRSPRIPCAALPDTHPAFSPEEVLYGATLRHSIRISCRIKAAFSDRYGTWRKFSASTYVMISPGRITVQQWIGYYYRAVSIRRYQRSCTPHGNTNALVSTRICCAASLENRLYGLFRFR